MKSSPWLIGSPLASRKLRLYCFSYAGGSAHAYSSWQAALGPDIEVCAIQLPGRGMRMAEQPYTSMQELVVALAQVLTKQDRTPFAFFGHSMGALLALELARFCARHSLDMPLCLIASGAAAPQFDRPPRNLHTLSDDALIDALRDYDGSPPEVLEHRELMALLLPMIRADFQLIESHVYRAGRPLELPLTVFVGDGDGQITQESAPHWQKETHGPCQVRQFQGGHFFINSDRAAVLSCLNATLMAQLAPPGEKAPAKAAQFSNE
ncbi:MAG: alpha/beta fold hydrolase [Telluria sp.]